MFWRAGNRATAANGWRPRRAHSAIGRRLPLACGIEPRQTGPVSSATANAVTAAAVRARGLLFRYPARQRGLLLVAVTASLLGSLVQLAFPLAAAAMIDLTLHGPAVATAPAWMADLNRVGLVLLALVLLVVWFNYLDITRFGMAGERAMAELRAGAFDRAVRLPMEFHGAHRGGEVSSWLLADLAMVQEFWIHDLRLALKDGVLVIGALVMMLVTSLQLALWLVLGAALLAPLVVFLGMRIRRLAAEAQQRLADSSVLAGETLAGMADVKAAGREHRAASDYRLAIDRFLTPALRGVRARGRLLASVVALILFGGVFFMWAGSRLVIDGQLTGGQLTQFLFFLSFLLTSAGSMAVVFGKWQRLRGAVDRIQTIFQTEPEPLDPPPAGRAPSTGLATTGLTAHPRAAHPPAAPAPPRAEGRLQFERVCFAYPARPEVMVLDGLDLEVAPGQMAAVVGPSGAGKSTLAGLLLRFYPPAGGVIRLDGRPLEDYPLSWVRRQIAWVPQDVGLTGGSLRDNIVFGQEGAGSDEVERAAEAAGLTGVIEALPQGFDTPLGERGSQLSGGQRQRVAIARALLRRPAVLILDEATSALDADNEEHVMRSLLPLQPRCTTLFITHRLHTVRACDLVVMMEAGRMVRQGSPDEVLEHTGAPLLLGERP